MGLTKHRGAKLFVGERRSDIQVEELSYWILRFAQVHRALYCGTAAVSAVRRRNGVSRSQLRVVRRLPAGYL